MSDKITVRVSYETRARWTKDVEMTRKQYDKYCEMLDRAGRARTRRALEEDIAADLGFDWAEEPDMEDPSLDDFYEVEEDVNVESV